MNFRGIILTLPLHGLPVHAAILDGDIVRINDSRFLSTQIKGYHIFIPTDESLTEEQKAQKSFCSSHLKNEEILLLRKGHIVFSDQNIPKLTQQCPLPQAKDNIPSKPSSQSLKSYDHRNAESYKSVLDYLLKK